MPSGTTVCDVGGGIGTVAMQLANAHPNLKLTLQDQPSVIEHARNVGVFFIAHTVVLLNDTFV